MFRTFTTDDIPLLRGTASRESMSDLVSDYDSESNAELLMADS